MDDFNDDPLDLLDDDSDGVIETILLFDDDKNESIQTRTGCLGLLTFIALPAPLIYLAYHFCRKSQN